MQASAAAKTLPGLELLEQTPGILADMLVAATAEEWAWKPSADRWSIREVLAHLVDVEVHCFYARVRVMVEQDSPRIEPYDQIAGLAKSQYANRPEFSGRDLLQEFRKQRTASLAVLRKLPVSACERTAEHAELGKITLGELMNEWAFHDLGHIRQIAELFRAHAFYPQMGPFQRYYSVNP